MLTAMLSPVRGQRGVNKASKSSTEGRLSLGRLSLLISKMIDTCKQTENERHKGEHGKK